MKIETSTSFVVAAGLISLTWPMGIAYASVRYVFTRQSIAQEVATLALPTSAVVSALATVVSIWRPPKEAASWVFRCAALGALLGDIWLALGAYVHDSRILHVLAGALLSSGLLYGAPIGFAVGTILGGEIVALERWFMRYARRDGQLGALALAVIINMTVGGTLWCLAERLHLRLLTVTIGTGYPIGINGEH